jgi:hypothetical protein
VLLAFSPILTAPLRGAAVALFAGFHLVAVGSSFDLGIFQWVMAVAWLPFLPAGFWSQLTGRPAQPEVGGTQRAALPLQFLAGAFLLCIALHNLETLRGNLRPDPRSGPAAWINRNLYLEQTWSLWSRVPANRYYVFAARLRDGRYVDLHRDGAPLDWNAPRRRSRNNHWWKYQLLVASPAGPPHRLLYAAYLERRWNRAHPPGQKVESLELWMLRGPRPTRSAPPLRRLRLWPAPPGRLRVR